MINRIFKTQLAKPNTLSPFTALACNFSTQPDGYNNSYIKTQDLDFDEADKLDMEDYNTKFMANKGYYRYMDMWKKPLERKRKRKARAKEIRDAHVAPLDQEAKIVIHNPALPLQLPTRPENMFAILNLNNTQYKVTHIF